MHYRESVKYKQAEFMHTRLLSEPDKQYNGTIVGVTEWGIFDAVTGGTLLAIGAFSPSVTKTSSQTLTVTVTETLSQ